MVFFALAPLFNHTFPRKNNHFCWDLYFCHSCYLKWCLNFFFFFQIFHNLCFLFFVDIYAMQGRSHNISHLQWENPLHRAIWLKFRPSFTKFLRNLIMISIWEKVRIQQFRKAKYSLLASVLHIVQRFFLTEPHTYLCTM